MTPACQTPRDARAARRIPSLAAALVGALGLSACASVPLDGPAPARDTQLQGRFGDCPEAPRAESFRKYKQLCGTRPNR